MIDGRNGRDISRRNYIAGLGSAAVAVGLAGCMGGDGSDNSGSNTLRIGTSSTGSATYAVSQGVASVVNENTDEVSIEGLPSDGSQANIGRLRNDEIEIGQFSSWDAAHIAEDMEPYDQLPYTLQKVVHVQGSQWLFCAPVDSGLETVADIGPDTRVSPAQEGAGARPALERALTHLPNDYERISIDFASQAGPMNEGRLDVGVVPVINTDITGSYIDELKNTVDVRILTIPDDILSDMGSDPLLSMAEFSMENFEGYADKPDVANGVSLDYGWAAKEELDGDLIYEFLSTAFENREALTEYHPVLNYWQEPEYWTGGWDMPWHQGASDFFEEQDLL